MNRRIDLAAVLEGSGKTRPEQVALFALINLGIVESLSSGLLSAAECLQVFFHADNCLFVRRKLRAKVADQIMSHGVQLPDLFDALPTDQAQREFNRELAKLRDLCLRLLGQQRSAA
ncbi:MAG: hypothetical protein NTY19_09365 [Planctomycetota bacterium]|nr:hypothetical protein [Planctomycetota bacterium]